MPPWSLQNSQNWLIFSHVEKNWQFFFFFLCRATPTPWATHKNSEKNDQNIMYPNMDLKKYQNSMYPGTWIWRKSKISCTRVHGCEEKTKFHVPGYMNLKKKFSCVAQGVEVARCKKYFFSLPIFFNMLFFFSIFGIL